MESNISEVAIYDFVMIIDADAYITNMSVSVENFFAHVVDRPIDFVVTSDGSHRAEVHESASYSSQVNHCSLVNFVVVVLQRRRSYASKHAVHAFVCR